jgi:hypothetical protein
MRLHLLQQVMLKSRCMAINLLISFGVNADLYQDLRKTPLPTSRGLSAGSSDLATPIDPADKPRDVEIGFFESRVYYPGYK